MKLRDPAQTIKKKPKHFHESYNFLISLLFAAFILIIIQSLAIINYFKMTSFVKITRGSFHQGNEKFGLTAGRQCTCCALFSVVFSTVKNPGNWNCADVNYVVDHGDQVYKDLNSTAYLMLNELPNSVSIMNLNFLINFLDTKSDLVGYKSVQYMVTRYNIR